jgi:hypothetical protein
MSAAQHMPPGCDRVDGVESACARGTVGCPWEHGAAAHALASPEPDWKGACERLTERLREIGDYAHDHSAGPAVWDHLWEVRRMAYEGEDLGVPTSPPPLAALPGEAEKEKANGD